MTSDQGKNKSGILYAGLFLLFVGVMGCLSLFNLTRYYIRGEEIDNDLAEAEGSQLEKDISGTFFARLSFVDLNGAIRRVLGQHEMNGVVKLDNGYLMMPLEKCTDESLRQFSGRTSVFNDYLREKGISLVYVSPPYTVGKFDPELPPGEEDFSNDNIDRFLSLLEENGIDTIDIRETMHEDGIDHYDMVYKTDHHWTTEAGFYTYNVLEKYIAEKTSCKTDPRISDISNYVLTKYNNSHLGSVGLRTGKYYAGTDDFTLIVPKFDTYIRDPEGKTGKVRDYFLDTGPLLERDGTLLYGYDKVLGGGAYLGDYVNLDPVNDVKILVISDSFSKAVIPYLIMGFAEVNTVLDGYVSSVTPELIEAYDPDIVIMMYYPKYINSNSGSFDFNGFS